MEMSEDQGAETETLETMQDEESEKSSEEVEVGQMAIALSNKGWSSLKESMKSEVQRENLFMMDDCRVAMDDCRLG